MKTGPTAKTEGKGSLLLGSWLEKQDRPARFGFFRIVSVVMVAALTAALPAVGPNRFAVALGMLFVVMPIAAMIEKYSRTETVDQWHSILDITYLAVCSVVIPAVYPGTAIITGVTLASNGQYMGRKRYALTVLIVAVYTAGGLYHDISYWYFVSIALAASLLPAIEFSKWYSISADIAMSRFALITTSANGFVWEYNPETKRFDKVDGRIKNIFGYDAENLLAKLTENSSAVGFAESSKSSGYKEVTLCIETVGGEKKWFRLSADRRVRSDQSVVVHGFAFDVTELEVSRLEQQIRAETDGLTQLPNRNGLISYFDESPRQHSALAILDVDRFKEVNDTLGHLVGDKVIVALANRYKRFSDEQVCIARIGGDEFAVASSSEDGDPYETVHRVVSEMVLASSEPLSVDGLELKISVSAGLSSGIDYDWTELLRRADIAMYEAKLAGGGMQVFTNAHNTGSNIDRLTLQGELARNLDSQVELWFQPIVDAATMKISRLEGLARWVHPERGLIPPLEFLNLIDSGGLTARFDSQVVEMAASASAQLEMMSAEIEVSANMSARSIWSPDLLEQLESIAEVDRRRLTIELTEQGLLDDHERIVPTLEKFSKLGIKLALDDYGTGASSLIRVRNLPFSEIKIDRSFVSGIETNKTDQAIVKSSLTLARDLGLRTVAEGVETKGQAKLLVEWGCDYLQGYLFSRAVPFDQLEFGQFDLSAEFNSDGSLVMIPDAPVHKPDHSIAK